VCTTNPGQLFTASPTASFALWSRLSYSCQLKSFGIVVSQQHQDRYLFLLSKTAVNCSNHTRRLQVGDWRWALVKWVCHYAIGEGCTSRPFATPASNASGRSGIARLIMEMLNIADRAVIVFGEENSRSKSMDAELLVAIERGGLQACQVLHS